MGLRIFVSSLLLNLAVGLGRFKSAFDCWRMRVVCMYMYVLYKYIHSTCSEEIFFIFYFFLFFIFNEFIPFYKSKLKRGKSFLE